MFERFTEEARQVVVHALEEERTLRQGRIGTEHLLLGLLSVQESGVARALKEDGVAIERVRSLVIETVGARDSERTSGQIPFTAGAKDAMEAARGASLERRLMWVGPEHILLGLASGGDSVSGRILTDLGVDAAAICDSIDGAG